MVQLNPWIEAKLKRIPDIAVEAARRAMEEGAEEIVRAMKAAVPARSGELRDSIGWTWGDLPPGTFMIDEIRSGKYAGDQYATLQLKIYAGSKRVFYARFVEHGTRSSGAAQPFFYPIWKAQRAKFKKRIRDQVRAAIRKAWRDG